MMTKTFWLAREKVSEKVQSRGSAQGAKTAPHNISSWGTNRAKDRPASLLRGSVSKKQPKKGPEEERPRIRRGPIWVKRGGGQMKKRGNGGFASLLRGSLSKSLLRGSNPRPILRLRRALFRACGEPFAYGGLCHLYSCFGRPYLRPAQRTEPREVNIR